MIQCNSNFEYRISKISNEQCSPCSFSYKIVYKIKFDAPIKGNRVYKEIWTSQKDDILYCKKDYCSEALDIDKHVAGI